MDVQHDDRTADEYEQYVNNLNWSDSERGDLDSDDEYASDYDPDFVTENVLHAAYSSYFEDEQEQAVDADGIEYSDNENVAEQLGEEAAPDAAAFETVDGKKTAAFALVLYFIVFFRF